MGKTPYNFINLIGQRFGRWVVLERAENKSGRTCWLCQCDCGKIKEVFGCHINSGKSQSCGCLSREINTQTNFKHGHCINSISTPIYTVWLAIHDRCNNTKKRAYKHYGARGITVCKRWNDFAKFLADMSPRPKGLTIDRINNDGNYEPDNCRWATYKQQKRNNRGTKLNPLKVQVIKKLFKESSLSTKAIADVFRVTRQTIYHIKTGRNWDDIKPEQELKRKLNIKC